MSRKHLLFEVDRIFDEHFIVNVGFFQAFLARGERVDAIVRSSHWDLLKKFINPQSLGHLTLIDPGGKWNRKNLLFRAHQFLWILRSSLRFSSYDSIWVLTSSAYFLFFMLFYQFLGSTPMFIMLHAEMQDLQGKRGVKKWCLEFLYRFPWRRHIKFLVLSEHIMQGLLEEGYDTSRFCWIEIPFPAGSEGVVNSSPKKKIALVGRHRDSAELRVIEKFFADPACEYELKILGQVQGVEGLEKFSLQSPWVEREVLERELADSSAVIVPYPEKSYRFSTSGVLFESVLIGVPVISFPNAHARYLRDQGYPVLVVKPEVGELVRALRELSSDTKTRDEFLRKRQAILTRHMPPFVGRQVRELFP